MCVLKCVCVCVHACNRPSRQCAWPPLLQPPSAALDILLLLLHVRDTPLSFSPDTRASAAHSTPAAVCTRAASSGDQPLQEAVLRAHTAVYFDSLAEVPSLNLTLPSLPSALGCDAAPALPHHLPACSTPPAPAGAGAARGPVLLAPTGGGGSDSKRGTDTGSDTSRGDRASVPGAGTAGGLAERACQDVGVSEGGDMGRGGRGGYGVVLDEKSGGHAGCAAGAPPDEAAQRLPVVMCPERAQAQVAAFLRAHKQRIADMVRVPWAQGAGGCCCWQGCKGCVACAQAPKPVQKHPYAQQLCVFA